MLVKNRGLINMLGETTAYSEFTSENNTEKADNYIMCSTIAHILNFKLTFRFNEFRICWPKPEESKENDGYDSFQPSINFIIEKNFKFRGILQLSQKEEWKRAFRDLKARIKLMELDESIPRDNEERFTKLETLIQSRIDSLQSSV